jgi:phosphoglycolate phosphatase
MILAALSETGTEPRDAVMIGDTGFDMEMGRAAGIRRIGVTWGYHDAARLTESGAEHLVHSYAELMALLASGRCWD